MQRGDHGAQAAPQSADPGRRDPASIHRDEPRRGADWEAAGPERGGADQQRAVGDERALDQLAGRAEQAEPPVRPGRVTRPEQAAYPQPDRDPGQAVAQHEDLADGEMEQPCGRHGQHHADRHTGPERAGPGARGQHDMGPDAAQNRRLNQRRLARAARRGQRQLIRPSATGQRERHRAQGRADRGADDGLIGRGPARADLPADHDRRGGRGGQPLADGGRERPGPETGQPGRHGHRDQDGQQQAGRQQRRGPGTPQHEHQPGPARRLASAGPGGGVTHVRPQTPAHDPTLRWPRPLFPRPCAAPGDLPPSGERCAGKAGPAPAGRAPGAVRQIRLPIWREIVATPGRSRAGQSFSQPGRQWISASTSSSAVHWPGGPASQSLITPSTPPARNRAVITGSA